MDMENEEIYSLLRQGEILEVEKAFESVKKWDNNLYILLNCVEVFHDEVTYNVEHTIFDYSTDIDELYKHYTKTKLLLRRFEFDLPKVYQDEFYEYCEHNWVSIWLIRNMISKSIIFKEKVCLRLAGLYGDKKGKDSLEYAFYFLLSNSLEEENK
jgi:hypothetical protein